MMRRRGFIRPKRLAGLSRMLRPVNPRVVEANNLFQTGHYQEAAILFEEIANKYRQIGGMNAPHLFLQAGRAWILDSAIEKGMEYMRMGLKMLLESQRIHALAQIGRRIVGFLQTRGLTTQAMEIESWLKENIPESPQASLNEQYKAKLPAACPTCGGPVHPSEITWENEEYPVCNYCGSIIETEE